MKLYEAKVKKNSYSSDQATYQIAATGIVAATTKAVKLLKKNHSANGAVLEVREIVEKVEMA